MKSITVVVPCFNEAGGIAKLKRELTPVLERLLEKRAVQLVLVDDGSTDDTHSLLKKTFPNALLVKHPRNLNLGAAISSGFREATSEIVAFLDSDCTCFNFPKARSGKRGNASFKARGGAYWTQLNPEASGALVARRVEAC